MMPFFFGRMYMMDDLFCCGSAKTDYAQLQRERKKLHRGKSYKRINALRGKRKKVHR